MFFLRLTNSAACTDVFTWQIQCEPPEYQNQTWVSDNCQPDKTWNQPCEVFPNVQCDGDRNFTRKQWCPYQKGKSYRIAILLSYLLGILGIDRFYLGYYSVGFMKLFTGGFFFVGFIVDAILITLQIVKPANGLGYYVTDPFPFYQHRTHHDVL